MNININYRRPAVLGDVLHIESEVSQLNGKSGIILQRVVLAGDNTLVADAALTFVCIDLRTQNRAAGRSYVNAGGIDDRAFLSWHAQKARQPAVRSQSAQAAFLFHRRHHAGRIGLVIGRPRARRWQAAHSPQPSPLTPL